MIKLPSFLKDSPMMFWIPFFILPLPFFLIFFHFTQKLDQLDQLDEEIERVHARAVQEEEMRRKDSVLLAALKHPDPHYLDKQIETLKFLVPECKKLEALGHIEEDFIEKRLQFLQNGNRLIFSEDEVRSAQNLRETEEKQQHAVEMNEEDLKKLLCIIEGVTIWPYGPKEGRPQLIIKDFKLSKKELSSQEKVFVISTELIKRENMYE